MRVAITGASGNVDTSVPEALPGEARVDSVLGIARRPPDWNAPKTEWAAADVRDADLRALFSGVGGIREGDGTGTPPLRPRAQLRLRELATRVGGTNP